MEVNYRNAKIATNHKPKVNLVIDNEKLLSDVVTSEYIIYSKEIIDL